MTEASPPSKARAYSDGDSAHELDFIERSLQRASSFEAHLPSYHDNGEFHCGSLSMSTTGSNDSFNGDNVAAIGACNVDNNALPPSYYYTSPRSSKPRPPRFARTKSDNSHSGSATRRLQTIESGITLADHRGASTQQEQGPTSPDNQASMTQPQQLSPQCQMQQDMNSSRSGSFSPVLPPRPPSNNSNSHGSLLPTMPPMDYTEKSDKIVWPDIQRVRVQSDHSYYSVDAGKHGFITQHRGGGPSSHGNPSNNSTYSQHSDNDSDVGSIETNSASDSLVFTYQPGQETPPAEYDLPASILKVYGVDCSDEANNNALAAALAPMENGKRIRWYRAGSDGEGINATNYYDKGSQSTIVFDVERGPSYTLGEAEERRNDEDTEKAASPPGQPSSLRAPHLMPPQSGVDISPVRILPYHERKRLVELEEEEKKRKKKKVAGKSARLHKSRQSGKVSKESLEEDEATPLAGRQREYGTGNTAYNDDDDSNVASTKPGWFGHLLSVVTGKSGNDSQQQQHHKRIISIDENAQSYRDRGQAFLQKTEKRRMQLKEQSRIDELNNVSIPVKNQSFGHSRAKMSSMSNALDSIVSCSDDDEEDSSDEESGSSYYFDHDDDARAWRNHDDKTPAATARVWKYGEPPTNPIPTKKTSASSYSSQTTKKKKTKSSSISTSKHDRIMKRERLLQEEYEYRLRTLKKENEKLSKRFRVFVLVAVALIFAGALAFAFVVCIRMLMVI
eukprot:CAMPEP_0196133420 /NCGR_PEP_ID=MMETSP0910-20130528/2654_1 /TAXON_ID=49265 /ORGANISM="Thalassiosira rotula, Strain GSO102" /LENGTH=732 /DNA_ID=CAMNT_0041393145 /DNA_START=180 /DNA_END=2378 /DNA_ORIENTATION=-